MNEKALVVLQARMSSTRFPGKVLEDLNGKPMLIRQIDRIRKARNISKIVVATTEDQSDNVLTELLRINCVEYIRGSVDDVFSRFESLLSREESTKIIRLTADCPLVMPELIDNMWLDFVESDCDYLSNTLIPTFPDGLDVEIFSKNSLFSLSKLQLNEVEREHVTLGFHTRQEQFKVRNFGSHLNLSGYRWTVDYPEDLEFVRKVYSNFVGREDVFKFEEVLDFVKCNPGIQSSISGSRRNESLVNVKKRV